MTRTQQLTEDGAQYARTHAASSMVARVALAANDDWPPGHKIAAIRAMNDAAKREQGRRAMARARYGDDAYRIA